MPVVDLPEWRPRATLRVVLLEGEPPYPVFFAVEVDGKDVGYISETSVRSAMQLMSFAHENFAARMGDKQ